MMGQHVDESRDNIVKAWICCGGFIAVWLMYQIITTVMYLRRKWIWKKRLGVEKLKLYDLNSLTKPDLKTLELLPISKKRLESEKHYPDDMLGTGTAGDVYLRHDLTDQARLVAVKIFKCPNDLHIDNAMLEIKVKSTSQSYHPPPHIDTDSS